MSESLGAALQEKDFKKAVAIADELNALRKNLNLEFISEDVQNLLKESKNGIERIRKIVMDLRTFSREDKEGMSLVNLNEVLESVINIVWNEIKYKADFLKNFEPLPLVQCSPQKIGQVFINILINATQAINGKGLIVVNTYCKEHKIYAEIIDNGMGIEKQNLSKIFNPFFTTKAVGTGTGLGLSISYEIIKKHGGDILVESELGKGTKFTVILPELSEKAVLFDEEKKFHG